MSVVHEIEVTLPTVHEIALDANEIFDGLAQGYCVHGTYVGGCAEDWMCGACESGEDRRDFVQVAEDRLTNWAWLDALNSHARDTLKAVAFLARHYENNPVKALNDIADFMADYQAERKQALARRSA